MLTLSRLVEKKAVGKGYSTVSRCVSKSKATAFGELVPKRKRAASTVFV